MAMWMRKIGGGSALAFEKSDIKIFFGSALSGVVAMAGVAESRTMKQSAEGRAEARRGEGARRGLMEWKRSCVIREILNIVSRRTILFSDAMK
jgi:hypothetical protein